MHNYEEYLKKKKIPISKGFFYAFIVLIATIVLTSTIEFVFSLSNEAFAEQLAYRKANLFTEAQLKELTDAAIVSEIRTIQIIKFGSVSFGSLAFCLMVWLGRSKIEYGLVFNFTWIIVYVLAGTYPFYVQIKESIADIFVLTFSMMVVIALIIWGVSLNVHRGKLKQNLKYQKLREY